MANIRIRRGWQEFRGEVFLHGRNEVVVVPEGEDVWTMFMPGVPGFEFWYAEAVRRGDDRRLPN